MVGWKGKDSVKDGVVAFSCLFCLRVSLLGFSSFCLKLSMIPLTLSEGCPVCKEVVLTVSSSFCKCWGSIGCELVGVYEDVHVRKRSIM